MHSALQKLNLTDKLKSGHQSSVTECLPSMNHKNIKIKWVHKRLSGLPVLMKETYNTQYKDGNILRTRAEIVYGLRTCYCRGICGKRHGNKEVRYGLSFLAGQPGVWLSGSTLPLTSTRPWVPSPPLPKEREIEEHRGRLWIWIRSTSRNSWMFVFNRFFPPFLVTAKLRDW